MKVTGIIVEYNPLHKGHIYHLQQAKEISGCDLIVACMSGNFVQRGEFAIIDKWTRAQAAINAGCNLVIELPFPFVCQSASQFGENAVNLLSLCQVDNIVFGSETNNLDELKEIANMSFNINNFKENMKQGFSYPASYGYMADSYGPNDILAISYLRALNKHPEIEAISIRRTSGYHDEQLNTQHSSALSIRKALIRGDDVSSQTSLADELVNYPSPTWDKMYPFVRTLLLTLSKEELAEIFLMDEGIESHLIKQAKAYNNFNEFINNSISKRYTRSRIQRTLCHLLIHNKKDDMKKLPIIDRIRPLAFDEKGQDYLKKLQKDGLIVVNHFTQNIKQFRDLEYKAAVAYAMAMDEEHYKKVVRGEIEGQFLNK